MLDFMIIGLPRSGTTWAANWLTSDVSRCVHDPLHTAHYRDWGRAADHAPGVLQGVSCTGIWRWPAWVNAQPARKVILRRHPQDIQKSLRDAGLPVQVGWPEVSQLESIEGTHVYWTDLFDTDRAESIWDYLVGTPFDQRRHAELRQIRMQPHRANLVVDEALQARLARELTPVVSTRE